MTTPNPATFAAELTAGADIGIVTCRLREQGATVSQPDAGQRVLQVFCANKEIATRVEAFLRRRQASDNASIKSYRQAVAQPG